MSRRYVPEGGLLHLAYSRPTPDLAGVMRVELRLNDAAALLAMNYATLRKLLGATNTPPDLRRRPRPPHWRLDSIRLIEHLNRVRPELAERLADALRDGRSRR